MARHDVIARLIDFLDHENYRVVHIVGQFTHSMELINRDNDKDRISAFHLRKEGEVMVKGDPPLELYEKLLHEVTRKQMQRLLDATKTRRK